MTVTVKSNVADLVVPKSIRRRAGIKPGDRLEFKVSGGIINIIPKLPSADDEYTPEQRRVIDAEIAEARKGPYHGPFNTADEMIDHIKGELKKRAALKKTKRSR
jgi:AbrB family looped-hinge helix DNA binding protein